MRCLSSSIFFLQRANLVHHSKKLKMWRLPKIEGSILKYKVYPLWPTYIGGRTMTLAKGYGIKMRCYGIVLGNILGTWGTYWKLERNIMGTKEKWKKKILLSATETLSSSLMDSTVNPKM
jgi:hypothetical protein